jgi:hypothetical protein
MLVRKIRGQNKIGKIILSRSDIELARKMGVPIENWVKNMLVYIAKKRRWEWYFNKENT